MSYRIELSPNNRAGCQATRCKNDGVKILKGELRQGVVVMFEEHQSMKYRHWGCVTPTIIHNWQESCEGDMELIDGYDVLPEDVQEMVKRALEQGHVDDDVWKGDLELNRFTGGRSQGMFVKTPKKKAGDDDDEGASPSKKPAPKKRGRGKQNNAEEADDPDDKPAPKKGRGKKAAKAEDDDGDDVLAEAPPAKRARKSKKTADDDGEAAEAEPAPKKTRGRKPKPAAHVDEDGEGDDAEQVAPVKTTRAKKGSKKAADADTNEVEAEVEPEEEKSKPQKRKARGKKAAIAEDE